jgi:hypothetical protein
MWNFGIDLWEIRFKTTEEPPQEHQFLIKIFFSLHKCGTKLPYLGYGSNMLDQEVETGQCSGARSYRMYRNKMIINDGMQKHINN